MFSEDYIRIIFSENDNKCFFLIYFTEDDLWNYQTLRRLKNHETKKPEI